MSKKKRYFPNKWSDLKRVPSKLFESIAYDEFMDWKIAGWEIPHEVSCIIREEDVCTGKVKEYVYKTDLGAKRKIRKLMDIGTSEFTVCSVDRIHYMKPDNDYEDEYEEEY
tara:strand:- start:57 stop:389 length:333 start_codon:yes stop_codon:yes gene_type:complete